MSFGLSGGFYPIGLPLLQGSRVALPSMPESFMVDGRLLVFMPGQRLLSVQLLDAYNRPASGPSGNHRKAATGNHPEPQEHRAPDSTTACHG